MSGLGYLIGVCVGCSNLHSINTFSNAASLMPHTVQWSLLFSPFILIIMIPVCSTASTPLLLSCVPFNTVACFPNLLVLRSVRMCCGLWNVTVEGVCSLVSLELVSSAWLSRLSDTRYPHQWLWRLWLSVATCTGSPRTSHVEDRVSERLKTKPSEFILFS